MTETSICFISFHKMYTFGVPCKLLFLVTVLSTCCFDALSKPDNVEDIKQTSAEKEAFYGGGYGGGYGLGGAGLCPYR